MDPSPFASPLSSPPKTPQSSPPKPSKSSPKSSPNQRPSPERQCACPCGPFKAELKAAATLMTFRRYPLPALIPYPYPSDSMTGDAVPVGELVKYSKAHVWPDGIHCFCSLRPGGEARSVRLIVPSRGSMRGLPCLGCPDWTPDGMGGCRYFVNLRDLFDGCEPLFGMVIPTQNFLLCGRAHVRKLLASSGSHPPVAKASSSVHAPSPVKPSAVPSVQDYFPYTFQFEGVKPGMISDPKRIWSPPPIRDVFCRVEEMPLPCAAEVREVFDEMVNGAGVPYRRLMGVIGGCQVCDQVMALPNILTHACLGLGKDKGPSPAKHPLLPEDKRSLPAAPSSIKKESDAGPVGGGDSDVEIVDGPTDAPKRKRKIGNASPPRVLVPAIKKPRLTNNGAPSTTPERTQPGKKVSTSIDLTDSPVRISTPEGSQKVYRHWNEEFIMYEKA